MSSRRLYRRYNGEYAFASSDPQWFGMGATQSEPMTAKEALAATGMDAMRFSEHPVFTTIEGFTTDDGQVMLPQTIEVPSHKAVILEEVEFEHLVPVTAIGKDREVFQFETLIEPLEIVLDVTESVIETCGLFAGGSEWFGFVRLPEDVTIGGDTHAMYLFGRDGLRSSFSIGPHAKRLECMNMFTAAIAAQSQAENRYVLQHRRGAKVNIEQIRATVRVAYKNASELDEAAKVLLDEKFSEEEFYAYADALLGTPDPKAGQRAVSNHEDRNRVLKRILYGDSTASSFRNAQPTKWTAFQTVTEYADHFSPVRSTDRKARRVERLVDGTHDTLKYAALALLR